MKSKQIPNNYRMAWLVMSMGMLLGAPALAADGASAPATVSASAAFATVGKTDITWREYNAAYNKVSRTRFYHGKPADNELALFQREIGNKLIDEALQVNEAKRRKLKPDTAYIQQMIKLQDERNAGNPRWQELRPQALPVLTRELEENSLREKLEAAVRKVPKPKDKQLREFYAANPVLFTQPEQLRVSVILLKVEPSAVPETWKRARAFGQDLIKQVKEGADFAELAKTYSGDTATASQGGDMGYLHGGMMSGLPEASVKNLKPGELSDVVNLMEGVGIFKLVERNEAKLSSYDLVKDRVRTLWAEAEGEHRWKALMGKLRNNGSVKVDESRYAPLGKPVVNNEGAAPASAPAK